MTMDPKEASRRECFCNMRGSTGRTLDAWANMQGWTDPRELSPPLGCLVDPVLQDSMLSVRGRRMLMRNGLEYWKMEGCDRYKLSDEILAWDWVLGE